MTTPILIDNCIVRTTRSGYGSIVESVRFYRRSHPRANIDLYPRVTMGHRIHDNYLLSYIINRNITVDDVMDSEKIQAIHFPPHSPPIIVPPPIYRIDHASMSYILK
jgi:hypothetical protein